MAPKGKEPENPAQENPPPTSIMQSVKARKTAMSTAIGMVCVGLLVFLVYQIERNNVAQLVGAVSGIRGVLIYHNESYDTLNDIQILAKTEQVLTDLAKIEKQNEAMSAKIKGITGLIKEGWIAFQGHLYGFSDASEHDYDIAKEDCKKRKTQLVFITTPNEQMFLEGVIKLKQKDYWIGLNRVEGYWQWITGKNQSEGVSYWADGNPTGTTEDGKDCAEIRRSGAALKAWFAIHCNETKPWICKMKPDPQMMDDSP